MITRERGAAALVLCAVLLPRSVAATPPAPPEENETGFEAHVEVQGRALADAGNLPGPAVGFGIAAALGNGRQWIELATATFLDRRATVSGDPPAGADIGLLEVSLGACHAVAIEHAWDLRLCATVHGGRLRVDGFGGPVANAHEPSWAAVSAGGSLWWSPGGPFSVFAGLDALVCLSRPRIEMADGRQVHLGTPVAVRLVLGPALHFP